MRSVILVGMPGCGKSTLGVLLAKELGLDFVDTDIVIQSRTGELLYKTLERVGVEGLLDEEEAAILSLDMTNPCVIATGGSAVLRENSVKHLSQNSVIVYLKLSCDTVKKRINNRATRGIAAKANETLEDIYSYRTPFYERCAEITVDCDGREPSENVASILEALKKVQ